MPSTEQLDLMEIYVDTADPEQIRQSTELGVVDGVTTNPSIVAETGLGYPAAIERIAPLIDGPVYAQVTAGDVEGMIAQAHEYDAVASAIVVKLPANRAGFRALAKVRADGIAAGTTVVFSLEQAVLAAKNGATFVAPYVGRLEDAGADGIGTVTAIQRSFDRYGFETTVLAASIRTSAQAAALYEVGVDAVTMAPAVLGAHVTDERTTQSIAGFAADWQDRDG